MTLHVYARRKNYHLEIISLEGLFRSVDPSISYRQKMAVARSTRMFIFCFVTFFLLTV